MSAASKSLFQWLKNLCNPLATAALCGVMLLQADYAAWGEDAPNAPIPAPPTEPHSPAKVEFAIPETRETHPRPQFSPRQIQDLVALSIPILAITLSLGIGALAIWTDYRKRQHFLNVCHQERMAAIEKGLELPPFPSDLSGAAARANRPRGSGLKPGLVCVGVGAGLYFMFGIGPATVVGFLGLALLLYYLIEGRKFRPIDSPKNP